MTLYVMVGVMGVFLVLAVFMTGLRLGIIHERLKWQKVMDEETVKTFGQKRERIEKLEKRMSPRGRKR